MSLREFQKVVREAVAFFSTHGFTSEYDLDQWAQAIQKAADDMLLSPQQASEAIAQHLRSIYGRMEAKIPKHLAQLQAKTAVRIGPEMFFRRVETYPQLASKMRMELDRRIAASADLIKIRRKESIAATLRRFKGWASSVPKGGTPKPKGPETELLMKDFRRVRFEANRLNVDQGHKLNASLNATFAEGTGAIAGIWHSHWKQLYYNYRKDHKERDEKIYLIRGSWADKAGLVKPSSGYTDQITQPAEEVYCFPGSTRVPWADGVSVGYRRWYSGELAEIVTATGKTLRATPNHPILTPQGWVAIGALKEGDHVIEIANEIVDPIPAKANEHDAIPAISQIFGALAEFGRSEVTGGKRQQFHGDGTEDDVNIVRAARPLSFGTIAQSGKHFGLAMSSPLRAALRAAQLFRDRDAVGAPSLMGLFGEGPSLFGAQLAHPFEAALADSVGDSLPLLGTVSAPLHGGSRGMVAGDVSRIAVEAPMHKEGSKLHDLSDLPYRLPFSVEAQRVVNVKRQRGATHVYNLQTESGVYAAEGIITHNCRCYYEYIYNLTELPPEMLTKKGKEAMATAQGVIKAS